jgi:putative isomerase
MSNEIKTFCDLLKNHIHAHFKETLRPAKDKLAFPFIVPGSQQYSMELWDWDSWLTNIAIAQVAADTDSPALASELLPHERGCIRNFITISQNACKWLGWMPFVVGPAGAEMPQQPFTAGVHKPCIAQHAAFLVRRDNGNIDWLREIDGLYSLQALLNYYKTHRHDTKTGLFFGDSTGVDDDPTVHGRPQFSTAPVFLNMMIVKEMEALIYLLECARMDEVVQGWKKDLSDLRDAIQRECWDERDGYFYSVDINLHHPEPGSWEHAGSKRHWEGLIQRIGVWTGFSGLWAGVATQEQAERIVKEHYRNEKTFNCQAGIRTLSKMEKMYRIRASGNPSTWLGPVWGISNYLVWRGLVRYGFTDDAQQLCDRHIMCLGKGLQAHGQLFEYYQPSNGEPLLNPGFQNWNQLVLNMIAWREGRTVVEEF